MPATHRLLILNRQLQGYPLTPQACSASAKDRVPVCLVLGAGAGVGQGVARRFAQEGYHACVVRRGGGKNSISGDDAKERTEAFCAELHKEGLLATPFFADGTNPEDTKDLVAKIERDVGPIHVAVYNIGAQVGNRSLDKTSYRIFEMAWRMGSLGAFAMAKEVAPFMAERGHGTLLYTSSTAAFRGNQAQHAHAAAMHARRGLCQSLNHEMGKKGIHVCHINLDGPVDAPDTVGRMMPDAYAKLKEEKFPMDKMLLPESIADTYFMIHKQKRNAWTLELDLRPWGDTAWFNSDGGTVQDMSKSR